MSNYSNRERISNYIKLMRFDKPIGFYLLMWPTLWALWIAGNGKPDVDITIIFVAGVILMRSAGCIINDFADRNIDGLVKRTEDRPLATGAIQPTEALSLAAILCAIAFALVLMTNWLTVALSIVALALAAIYPFMKRVTYLPQVVLGLAFAWAIPMAFAAQTQSIPIVAWLLLTATVLWATAYDTMYAMVDREEDIEIGVKSTAILFDDADRLIIGGIQVTFLATLVIVGNKLELGPAYYLGICAASALCVYQQYLIKDREPEKCLYAFMNNNWVGAVIFCGLLVHYLLNPVTSP